MLVLMAVLAPLAFGVLQSGGFTDASSSSSRASALVDRDFGGEANLDLLVTPRDGQSLKSAPVTALARRVSAQLAARSDVESVTSYWTGHAAALRGNDGRSALITMYVTGNDQAQTNAAKAITAQFAPATGDTSRGAGLGAANISVGGTLAVNADTTHGVAQSLGRAEAFAVPLTLVLLILAFGSLLAALLPLTIGPFAVAGTFAELAVLGRITDVSIYAIDLTTALGLGLGMDYSLLMISRFREELHRAADGPGDPVRAAVIATLRSAGRTIMFSSVTVAVALAALLVFPVYFPRSFAYAGIGVVAIAALASLILLPALLATFGTRLARTRRLRIRRSPAPAQTGDSTFWRRVATTVMRRPVRPGVKARPRRLRRAPAGPAERRGRSGRGHPRRCHLSAGDRARRRRVGRRPTAGPRHPRRPGPGPSTTLVGGSAAALIDTLAAVSGGLPWALLSIALTTFMLLFLFTGSVVVPIKALALNALSLTAVFGALVWIFQDGHLAGLLGFTPGPTDVSMILLIFCIAFGLSMDYEVFLLARIKEAHDAGADTVEAVATGLARTGRIVTTAAALLAITFFAFGTAQVSFIQLFGIGTGIAIVLDATVIRGLLVPAFMRLAGGLNWWSPPVLRHLYRRIGLAETALPAGQAADQRVGQPATTNIPIGRDA